MKKILKRQTLLRLARNFWRVSTGPLAILYIAYANPGTIGYGMTYWKRIKLGVRFWFNHSRMRRAGMQLGTSWRAHLVMAMKMFELPREMQGDVVECGCWQGSATVNLSLACAITGRKLLVYDSFEGLPPAVAGDSVAERTYRNGFIPGLFKGSLELVRENVQRYGDVSICVFNKGWYEDTLQHHEGPIVMMFLDVDFFSSLHECLLNLWPWLAEDGLLFVDEYNNLPYCAAFFSEKYWDKYFSSPPPGLIGTGTGVQVGMFYYNPVVKLRAPKVMNPESVSYCVKGTEAIWDFYPEEKAESVVD